MTEKKNMMNARHRPVGADVIHNASVVSACM